MKKAISIVCILLLLVATSNLAVSIHFCGGEISSVNFLGKGENCGSCNAKGSVFDKESCCKNIATTIAVDDTTTTEFSFQTEQHAEAPFPVLLHIVTPSAYAVKSLTGSVTCHAPPALAAQPYYILYRSLII